MKARQKIDKKYLFAGLTIVSNYFALYVSYLHENGSKLGIFRYLMIVMTSGLYYVTFRIDKNKENNFNRQLRVVNTVILIVLLLMSPALRIYISDCALYMLFSWMIMMIVCLSNIIYDKNVYFAYMVQKRNLIILLCCISAVLILSSKFGTSYFLWDSYDMFRCVDKMDEYSLFNFAELSFSRHVSYSFSALCAIFKIFAGGNSVMAQTISGGVLYVIGIFGFYRCIKLFDSDNKRLLEIALTLLYAFSPYMFGMMTYCYPDYAIWCVTPILIYELYVGNYMLVTFIGLFYLFTKETATISYVFLLLGNYVVNVIKKKGLFYEFDKYIFTTVPCLLWLFSYITIDHWKGSGAFGIQDWYIKARLQASLAINFNWLLITIILIFMFFLNKDDNYSTIVPILTSAIAYTVFHVLFRTVIHPRYIDALVAQIYILVAYVVLKVKFEYNVKLFVSCAMTVLMLFQSFFTIDPVMYKIFTNVNIGDTKMVTTSEVLSDGMAYNRQYQGWGKVTDLALEDIVNKENSVIFMPALHNNTWHFNAVGSFGMLDDTNFIAAKEYWDSQKRTRMTSGYDEKNIEFTIYMINSDYCIDIEDGECGFLLYSDLGGEDIADNVKEKYSYDEKEFKYNGWNIKRLEFWN